MLLSCNNLYKNHNEKRILEDVSFSIHDNEKVALIGINGTGKTTFLRILAGLEEYEKGTIVKRNGLRISYLSQTPSIQKGVSVFEQVMKGNDIEEFEAKSVLTKLGIIDFNQRTDHLSGGQLKRVALACVLVQPCDLLILDEPTNHLDNEMVAWLEKYLQKLKRAIIMVTHDRYFLDRITNRIIEIDQGKLYSYHANYSAFLELKEQREKMAFANERKRKSILKKELEWIRAGVQARGTKSKERIERFHKLNDMEMMTDKEQVTLDTVSTRLGKKTIEFSNLSKRYDDHLLFYNFEYNVKRNDRIGILGPNGCGKSTLLHVLAKQIPPTTGDVLYGETVKLAYYKQDDTDMDPSMRVIDYIKATSNEIVTQDGTYNASSMLERFLFTSSLQYQKIGSLSGGEKRRLYLLKILMEAPNILFLDEPTNDLDIVTLRILEDYLDNFDGAIITVSHDRYFLDRVCDKMFVFQNDHTLKQYIGGYSMYIDMMSDTKVKVEKNTINKTSTVPKMTSKEKQELERMESDINILQQAIDNVDKEMNDVSDDYTKIEILSKNREDLQKKVEDKMERWIILSDKKETLDNYFKH